ncbi:mevalonate kinase [Vagococcus silagei]|uniref:Mevalonate kinase n=1 Tax=Vagococcus silagei TaxID=2508885 RepID=A0A4S3BAI6_9ENTE|nr:mevalonate kinase [Vagococcus silagei]THB62365.1 mevalonate kinase [Vagococcus silagei]
MTQHTGIGLANGKIILLGEHSVVYHQPSIAIPFPAVTIKTSVTAQQDKTTIDCDFYHGIVDEMPELLESLKETIRVCTKRLNQKETPLAITIESRIPAERGMGSSAAVAVATTRAIYDYFNATLTQDELLEIVDIAEKIAHGNPSGLDALMTSSSIPFYYIKGRPFQPITPHLNAYLIVADTGVTGQTKEAVASVAEKLNGVDGPKYQAIINRLGELADLGRFALENNQCTALGSYMTEVHQLLTDLGVSNNALNTLVQAALDTDALGAKLTGGGRGGCMIALAQDKHHAERIQASLIKAGAKNTWLHEMSVKNGK